VIPRPVPQVLVFQDCLAGQYFSEEEITEFRFPQEGQKDQILSLFYPFFPFQKP
jgi:hypothetical protein